MDIINNLFSRLLGKDKRYLPADPNSHYFQKEKQKSKGEKIDELLRKL